MINVKGEVIDSATKNAMSLLQVHLLLDEMMNLLLDQNPLEVGRTIKKASSIISTRLEVFKQEQ